ncbi:hypothetical protein SBC2_09930 [Caballeronia sp. SBC2]|nr:hypothetical protein SBC2_09930 [Caballeronia sp. SBC2]
MPMLLEYIDAIARKKKRDVLFLEFTEAKRPKTRLEASVVTKTSKAENVFWNCSMPMSYRGPCVVESRERTVGARMRAKSILTFPMT